MKRHPQTSDQPGNRMKPSILILGALYFAVMFFFESTIFDSSANNDYEMAPSQKGYINIYGEPVELSDYFGNYLWVDYAAEWCSYCDRQTKTLKALEHKYADHLEFLTVVTGTSDVMQSPSGDTAKDWAEKYKLNPEMVIARDLSNTLPYNRLYSPTGEVLFEKSGLMRNHEVEAVINNLRSQ